MTSAIPSPERVVAVRAAAEAICKERGHDPNWPHNGGPGWWTTYRVDALAALIAYARAMGRDIEAEQLERMSDE